MRKQSDFQLWRHCSSGIMLALGVAALGPWPIAERWRRRRARLGFEPAPRRTSRIVRRSRWPSRPTAPACWSPTRRRARVSLVDTKTGRVLHELKTGDKPAGVALSRDGRRGVVTHWYGYDLAILEIKDDKIAVAGRIEVGPEPRGVAMTADGSTAYRGRGGQQRGGPRRPECHARSPAG